MKAMSSSMTKGVSAGTYLTCADNSGAKQFQIVSVNGYKGTRRTKPSGGVGSIVKCRVPKGNEKVRRQLFSCVIVRQRREYKRFDGTRIRFEDNAAVIIEKTKKAYETKGTLIKGPVAREAVDRFPAIGKIASQVV